ncbi:MAG: hypothetical protein A2341_06000 [Deltaproteobacteria bacterium RIFOXYB12_FULL_58_9]|nr:MAG: hypothetical protein A2341_06000 [Deltaproteobacteria bacterium RIFOXYB12_FULL_58_9]
MRDPRHIVLAAGFLLFIYGVPIAQGLLDIDNDMRPQALDLFDLTEADQDANILIQFRQKIDSAMDAKRLREFEDALEDNSLFEEKGRQAFQFFSLLATGDLGHKALRGKDDWYFFSEGVDYLAEPYFRSSHSVATEDPIPAVADFAKQLADRGIDLLFVPVPGKASIYPDYLTGWAEPGAEIYANTTELRRELEAQGVRVFDLHEVLSKARKELDTPLYMKTDTHWTGAGVRVVAAALAKRIRAGGWCPPTPEQPRYRRDPVRVNRRGDVIEMTKIPGRESVFADEVVAVLQVRQIQDGELYGDDPESSILILGDSFSRVFHTDSPKSAGLIANLAFELQVPIAAIVNDGGASTLVREQLARKPELLAGKRLVIWEFVERDVRFGRKGWEKIALDE